MENGNAPEAPRESSWLSLVRSLFRTIVFYWVIRQIASGFLSPKGSSPSSSSPSASSLAGSAPGLKTFSPIWMRGTLSDLYVYLSPSSSATDIQYGNPIWTEKGIVYGSNDERAKELVIPCSSDLQKNGSLYAHIFLTKSGATPDPQNPAFDQDTLYHRKLLTRYLRKRKETTKKKLVAGSSNTSTSTDTEDVVENQDVSTNNPLPIISYWWPNMTIHITSSDDPLPVQSPPLVLRQLRLSSDGKAFYPFFFVNDFWLLQENLMPINETVKSLNLSLTFGHLAMWKFQLYTQFQESFRIQQDVMGVAQSETDQMKRMFLETNPILLAVTFLVSLLHSIFDFLAFKNGIFLLFIFILYHSTESWHKNEDIDFWKNRKDMEGLSFRTILLNVVFQTIIFLYLLDNETSWMILISSGVGLLIEIWKINKSVKVVRRDSFPFIAFLDRVKPSKLTSKTRKYDEMAFKYLSWAFFPLLVGYTIYSLVYEEHKSWYSFIVGTLVGFVYTFGFISMTPQLFINYKLKSVAHMPWKTFMYKALNTFIDDLFAFVIKMPLLHRLACLRDDVVFLIYLYQKWIYPEDKRRRNEFGQVGEADDGEEDESDDDDEGKGPKLLKDPDEETKERTTLLAKKDEGDAPPRERQKTTRSKSPSRSPAMKEEAKKDL